MYILRVRDHFDAAHFLPWHEGKCKNLHGHRWEVEVVLEADKPTSSGIIADFGIIKDILRRVLPDHCPLNPHTYFKSLIKEFPEFESHLLYIADSLTDVCDNPTAEMLAYRIYWDFLDVITDMVEDGSFGETPVGFSLSEVTVWESPNCSVTYKEGENNESP